jgi:hypothetical protein
MARPTDPRSRSAAARIIGVPEATLRSLESRKVLEPVADWGVTDLVWAKIAATPGVDPASLPPVPKRIDPRAWLLLPRGSGRGALVGNLDELREASDSLDCHVVLLPIGAWSREVGDRWA